MKAIIEQGTSEVSPRISREERSVRAPRQIDKRSSWAAGWAMGGAAAWAIMAVLARVGVVRLGAIELIFLFAPLVIVPLGLELARMGGSPARGTASWLVDITRLLQPVGAVLVVIAFLLPVGKWSGITACAWMAVCGWAGISGGAELVRTFMQRRGKGGSEAEEAVVRGSLPLVWSTSDEGIAEIAGAVARIDLVVGAAWLIASRMGMRPMGIQEPIGLLTAMHFHFAGFATAMIAGAMAASASGKKWLRRVVLLVIFMPFLVAAGFVLSPLLKMLAAAAFSASVAGLAIFLWNCHARDRRARRFLQAAAASVVAGVILAAVYAVADYLGSDMLTIPRMASTHSILNGFGFCLLGLLGWIVEYDAN